MWTILNGKLRSGLLWNIAYKNPKTKIERHNNVLQNMRELMICDTVIISRDDRRERAREEHQIGNQETWLEA